MTNDLKQRVTDELKPCPFCGGEATAMRGNYWRVECARYEPVRGCRAQTGINDTKADAVAAWNRREAASVSSSGEAVAGPSFTISLIEFVDEAINNNPDKAEQALARPSLQGWFAGKAIKAWSEIGGTADYEEVCKMVAERLGVAAHPSPTSVQTGVAGQLKALAEAIDNKPITLVRSDAALFRRAAAILSALSSAPAPSDAAGEGK